MKKYKTFNPIPYEAHSVVYSLVSTGSNVLDVGCATGYFARELRKKNCATWGVEIDKKAAREARKYCEQVYVCNLNEEKELPFPQKFFDYILFIDVLEHLVEPGKALMLVKKYVKDSGSLIVSIPNVAHISVRLNLLLGRFEYREIGIMDRSHLRFFTKKSLLRMFAKTGLVVHNLYYSSDFGQIPLAGRLLRRIPKRLQDLLTKVCNTLLAVQFIAVCEK